MNTRQKVLISAGLVSLAGVAFTAHAYVNYLYDRFPGHDRKDIRKAFRRMFRKSFNGEYNAVGGLEDKSDEEMDAIFARELDWVLTHK